MAATNKPQVLVHTLPAIRVPGEMYDEIMTATERLGVTVSALTRYALRVTLAGLRGADRLPD